MMDAANRKPDGTADAKNASSTIDYGKIPSGQGKGTLVGGAAGSKKSKREKPSFPEFLLALKQAITTEPQRRRFAAIIKALKSGYRGKVTLPDVESVFGVIKGAPDCGRVALRLCMMSRGTRPSEFIRFLRGRLLAHARHLVVYPDKLESETQDERRENLLRWLAAQHGGGTSALPPIEATERARWVLTLVVEEPFLVRTDATYAILERLAYKPEQTKKGEDDDQFLHEIERLVAGEKLNRHRITSGLIIAQGARSCGTRLRDELVSAEAEVKTKHAYLNELKNRITELNQRLHDAETRSSALEALLGGKTEELATEKKERALDSEHWQVQSEQRLTRLVQDISTRLLHEIREAKLCLSGESPNLQMAMDRLAQMEEALSKLRTR